MVRAIAHAGFALVLYSATCFPAMSQDFLEIPLEWNIVQEPKTFRDVLHKCVRDDPECSALVDVLGAEVGIPPGAIKETMELADAIGLGTNYKIDGEEHRGEVVAPDGYRICDARLNLTSIAPKYDRQSPTFTISHPPNVGVATDKIKIYSFVHRQGLGDGRSWVDAAVTVKFVKDGVSDVGGCRLINPNFGNRYSCKGEACASFAYGSMEFVIPWTE